MFQIEEKIRRSELEKRNLIDEDDKNLLRDCERICGEITRFGNDELEQVVSNRFSELKRHLSALIRVCF